MKLWIDAQLPSTLARWIAQNFGVDAGTLDELSLRHADDRDIFAALRTPGNVIVSKDEDFVDLVVRLGAPPQIVWVTCGNVTNRALREFLTPVLPSVLALLEQGEPVVEI